MKYKYHERNDIELRKESSMMSKYSYNTLEIIQHTINDFTINRPCTSTYFWFFLNFKMINENGSKFNIWITFCEYDIVDDLCMIRLYWICNGVNFHQTFYEKSWIECMAKCVNYFKTDNMYICLCFRSIWWRHWTYFYSVNELLLCLLQKKTLVLLER